MIGVKNNASKSSFFVPDMTALLDVIFILLVFLLLTANTVPKVLQVDLPQKGKSQAVALELSNQISITLFSEDNRWGLDSEEYVNWLVFEIALNEKIRTLKSAQKEPQIIIAGDKQAPLGKVMQLFSWLQGNDLSVAQVMMSPE